MRVLVAEDRRVLADTITQGLRREGMAVDVVYDGAQAGELAAANPYDVVVLDRDLPVVHGDDICRELAGGVSRVLMLTASGTVSDRVQGLNLGADDYLSPSAAGPARYQHGSGTGPSAGSDPGHDVHQLHARGYALCRDRRVGGAGQRPSRAADRGRRPPPARSVRRRRSAQPQLLAFAPAAIAAPTAAPNFCQSNPTTKRALVSMITRFGESSSLCTVRAPTSPGSRSVPDSAA
jgi:CheY-like chemotaxis protein